MIVLLNKPFNVLCQFTDPQARKTLADYISLKNIYAAGRLDYDSEGLVVLTDDGKLQSAITHPDAKCLKTYWVQIEGNINAPAISKLCAGVDLKDGVTAPADVRVIAEPENLWPRNPPVRYRKDIPTMWLEISITEGKNRQVRRMTASVGYPTLRLIRYRIGPWNLGDLAPGAYLELSKEDIQTTTAQLTFVNPRRRRKSGPGRTSRSRTHSPGRNSRKT